MAANIEMTPSNGVNSVAVAASTLLALHQRCAASDEILAACKRLFAVVEPELLCRERATMAAGDADLAALVRRHGEILLSLAHQVRELGRAGAQLSPRFIQFVGSLVDQNARAIEA